VKTFVSIASLIGLLFLTASGPAHRQQCAEETKLVVLAPGQADAELKRYKQNGWALVEIMTGSPISRTDKLRGYLLKRPKQ
jgi:hypothetical protein